MEHKARPNRWKRFEYWDERSLRLDRFAPDSYVDGFSAFNSPSDPAPSLKIKNGSIIEMDGKCVRDFDMIDTFIASHHIDIDVCEQAMQIKSPEFARKLVDINCSRSELTRLAKGMTPAKLVEILSCLSTVELTFAQTKLRARKTPANQAHITNAKDDPVQMAADAATASAMGFDEIETTMRVAQNAWSNAVACMVGAAITGNGTLFQCSFEEAEELKLGMAGLTSYTETVSVYGTEGSFIDGDDTPWSKAFLISAYNSRGIKARCTSGAGAELLMGFHNSHSMLYLEARCLCVLSGIGVQGVQNGGIDGAPVTASVTGGMREVLAENLLAALLDLECASGNDTRVSESEIRVGAKIMPHLMAGTDFITSGFGFIPAYVNSFNASLFNGEELEDFLVLQRDYECDGGIKNISEDEISLLRMQAVEALRSVYKFFDLGEISEDQGNSVVAAHGSKDTNTFSLKEVRDISNRIKNKSITLVDIIIALYKSEFKAIAKNLLFMLKQRLIGDYLQTSAIFRNGKVLSALNDPNDYMGPGTGYKVSPKRRDEISQIRDLTDKKEIFLYQKKYANIERRNYSLIEKGIAKVGTNKNEVVIGISPAFGIQIFRSTADHFGSEILRSILEGIAEKSCVARVVRIKHTADTSFLGLTAANLSGSGYSIGLQAKGTSVIHNKKRYPHNNIELFSQAPITTLKDYFNLGKNAASYVLGEDPPPVAVQYSGQALSSRYHVQTALIYAIETGLIVEAAKPQELEVVFHA